MVIVYRKLVKFRADSNSSPVSSMFRSLGLVSFHAQSNHVVHKYPNCLICVNPVQLNKTPISLCLFIAKLTIIPTQNAKTSPILSLPNTEMAQLEKLNCTSTQSDCVLCH